MSDYTGRNLEILIAEDSPTQAVQLQYVLEQRDYRVALARNGREALAHLQTHKPDLVISDIVMPEVDGYQLCRHIKNDARLKGVPVVLLTSLSDPEDVIRALECGADNFITKPYKEDFLHYRIENILQNLQLRQSATEGREGMEIYYGGEKHVLNLEPAQVLDLLLSTYENAIQKNRELQKAHEDLRQAHLHLKQLSELKDEFLRIASHDLKNPLTTIFGSACTLEMIVSPGEAMTEDAFEFITSIKSRSQVMHRIIEDFLDFQAMEDGQISLKLGPTDLNAVARQVVENHADYARSKGIDLGLDLDLELPPIQADGARLSQVVENFVSNAIKFSSEGSRAVVRTRALDGLALVEVADSGPGLTEEDMHKLFMKYARLSNKPTGSEKSSGLGLAICKQLIELHKGEIGARNNSDKGSTFWFRIPQTG